MIVRLTGGLGNQMLMWAFGQGLSARRKEPVQYDWRRSSWDYGLDVYGIEMNQALPDNLHKIYEEPCFNFDPKVFEQPSGTYYTGYWQTEKYFENIKNEIKERFTLKTVRPVVEEYAKSLRIGNSVFIHVRRGDYLNPKTSAFHGNLDHTSSEDGYYRRAEDYVYEKVDKPWFIIFSDDPEWCRQNLLYPVISGFFKPHEEIYLMSQCKHGIMANSSFSWWANWLGDYDGRVVVAPKKWFANPEIDTKDLIPDRWIRL